MPIRVFVVYLVTLLLLFRSTNAYTQRIPFYNLSIEQGLIQSQATCLSQDRYGHLWIGTLGGLSRWDGHAFANYSVRDGLPSNTILSLNNAPDNKLCIGTAKGLSLYDGHKFSNYIFSSPDNPQGNAVVSVQTTSRSIWCLAGGKVHTIEAGKVRTLTIPGTHERVTAIRASKDDRLWISFLNATSVYRYYNGSWDSIAFIPLPYKPFIFRLYEDKQDKMWAITNGGLFQVNNGKLQPAAVNKKLQHHPIPFSMAQDANGNYWLPAVSGAIKIIDTAVIFLNRTNGLTDNRVFACLTDREGNVWIATDGQGIYRYSGAPFTVLDETSGLPGNQITSFAMDNHGAIFMSTYEAGIFRYQGGKVTQTRFPKDLPAVSLAFAYNKMWVGVRGRGLYVLDGESWHPYKNNPFNTISTLRTDAQGRLWIGAGEGLAVLDADSMHIMPFKEGLVSDILDISEDSMLIATGNGLKWCIEDSLIRCTTHGAADSATIQCMTRQGNVIYFGTSDNGIIVYNLSTRRSTTIGRPEGLRSEFIYNLIFDDNGDLWAGTGYGIHRLHFIQGGSFTIAFYGQEAGLRGMESNHNAVLKLPDGSIWFGTTGGALHYRQGSSEMKTSPQSLVLQSVLLFGQPIHDTNYYKGQSPYYNMPLNLRLPYRENNLTFTFNGITLGNGATLQYRYQLIGLDEKWSSWSSIKTVNYSALPPGKYTLAIQSKGENDAKIVSLEYPFEIITPFHKTAAFRLLILGACILLGVSLQYYAARRRVARERMIEALRREEQAKVRQRTAEDFHDEVGNKITRINVLASVLKSKLGKPPEDIVRIIDSIQDNTGQLYQGTRDILWSLKPSNDSLYEIINRVVHFGQDLFGDTPVQFIHSGLDDTWKNYRLPMDASRNLIMIFKEALNNVLKHSGASEVNLNASMEGGVLLLSLADNGKGFDEENMLRGHGLDNMQNRAKRLNGALTISSKCGIGTTLTLTAKIPSTKG